MSELVIQCCETSHSFGGCVCSCTSRVCAVVYLVWCGVFEGVVVCVARALGVWE